MPAPGTVEFTAASSSAGEAGSLSVTVELTVLGGGTLGGGGSVRVVAGGGTAQSGVDYLPLISTLVFAPGSPDGSTMTVTTGVLTDTLIEGDETAQLVLLTPTGSVSLGTQTTHDVTIADAQVARLNFDVNASTGGEGTVHDVGLTLQTPQGGTLAAPVLVDIQMHAGTSSAVEGLDLLAIPSPTLSFPAGAGASMRQLSLTLLNDTLVEGDEEARLFLQSPSGPAVLGPGFSHTVTLADANPATVAFQSGSSATLDESTQLAIPVELSLAPGDVLAIGVDALFGALPTSTATPNRDYALLTPGLSFPVGSSDGAQATVLIDPIDDTQFEGPETIQLNLLTSAAANPGSPSQHLVTLTEDDPPPVGTYTTERVAPLFVEPDGPSSGPSISGDGRLVAFVSSATNLDGTDTNGVSDAFLFDLQSGGVQRISRVDGSQTAADGPTSAVSIAQTGRWVCFASAATNLVAGDTNGVQDVFLRDALLRVTRRISVGSGGQADGASSEPVFSGDERFVAFSSLATNLQGGDTNGVSDVFLHELASGAIERVSLNGALVEGNGPSRGPTLSARGERVAFVSAATNLVAGDTNGADDVFVRDRGSPGGTARVSVSSAGLEGDAPSWGPAISPDGRRVAFVSAASNLVAGDTNGVADAFLRDLSTGTTVRVSLGPGGQEANAPCTAVALSRGGDLVAFLSAASNLVAGDTNGAPDVFLHDVASGITARLSQSSNGVAADAASGPPSLSWSGDSLAFASAASTLVTADANGVTDIFLCRAVPTLTRRINLDSSGNESNAFAGAPSNSGDGRLVAFIAAATNLVPGDTNGVIDVFLRDTHAGLTSRLSVDGAGVEANDVSDQPAVSADGRFVVFRSNASNLVPGAHGAIYLRDLLTGTLELISVTPAGTSSLGQHEEPSISADGRFVAFQSTASDLVAGDANMQRDVFVRDRLSGGTVLASVSSAGVQGNLGSSQPAISGDGRFVVFTSASDTFAANDTNGDVDVYRHDLQTGDTQRVSLDSAGNQGNLDPGYDPAIDHDGRTVVFTSRSVLDPRDPGLNDDVYLRDMVAGTTTLVSRSRTGLSPSSVQDSGHASISADGRWVVFEGDSQTIYLVVGDTNTSQDVFLYDVAFGVTSRISVSNLGRQVPNSVAAGIAISADGRVLSFGANGVGFVLNDANGQGDIFRRNNPLLR